MILQALKGYYDRKSALGDGSLPKEGWIRRGVDYVIILDQEGKCLDISPVGKLEKGKTIPREMLLPAIGKQALKHTNSGEDANLLWDNARFMFGTGNNGAKKLASFIVTLNQWLEDAQDEGFIAVKRFCLALQSQPDSLRPLLEKFKVTDDFEKRDPTLVFRLISDIEEVHARPAIRSCYENKILTTESSLRGNCLVTGSVNVPLASNETVIKGIWGGQPAGCNIVSFNKDSFISYGKRGRNGENAPIGIAASFAYVTALNHLLSMNRQRVQVGDASTVFWAEQPHDLETMAVDLFGEPSKDEPDRGIDALKALYQSVESGRFSIGDEKTPFHVLGLAPNAARISIRFWQTAPAMVLARRLKHHFDDVKIDRGPYDQEHLSITAILRGCSRRKSDGTYEIPPNLGGDIIRAILEDLPYPVTLLNAAVQRSRAERKVTYPRAAILKACLNREIRRTHRNTLEPKKEFTEMLDPNNTDAAYRMGRLFAVLEKIQEEANPGINATIRDRYYGAASSSPATVFPLLLKLVTHHIGKLDEKSSKILYRAFNDHKPDAYIGEILNHVTEIPPQLRLPEQGRFALGYYHQRQAFFTKREKADTATAQETLAAPETV